jgi:hypothetical protein
MASSKQGSRPHLDVGLAGQALDRGREFVEGGGIDQVDGEAHRHADRDGGHGQQRRASGGRATRRTAASATAGLRPAFHRQLLAWRFAFSARPPRASARGAARGFVAPICGAGAGARTAWRAPARRAAARCSPFAPSSSASRVRCARFCAMRSLLSASRCASRAGSVRPAGTPAGGASSAPLAVGAGTVAVADLAATLHL